MKKKRKEKKRKERKRKENKKETRKDLDLRGSDREEIEKVKGNEGSAKKEKEKRFFFLSLFVPQLPQLKSMIPTTNSFKMSATAAPELQDHS